jgi:arylsulfatase A-like enzyme
MTPAAARGLAVRLSLAAYAVAATEAALITSRTPSGVDTLSGVLAVFSACGALALGVAALVWALLWGLERALSEWRRRSGRTFGFETNLALLVLLPPVLAVSTLAGRFFFGAFSNVELSGFLSALVTLAVAGAALLTSVFLRALIERARAGKNERSRGVSLAALGFYFAVWAALSQRVLGLRQLDAGLAFAALAGAGGFFSGRFAVRHAPATLLGLLAGFSLGLGLMTRSATTPPFAAMARHGSWSKAAVTRARLCFDADADGFSPWFSGGDCDDANAAIHPGAAEIARDGLDNDCSGSDAREAPRPPAPGRPVLLPETIPEPLDLVLVTIETLRPDHLSLLGYDRPTTPELSALAADSVVFERTYAAAPGTRLSLAALLSGRTPSALRWLRQEPARAMRRLAPENPWLPATLQQHGYTTLAVHTRFRAFTEVENAGFDRGFDVYDASTPLEFVGGAMRGFPGQRQVDRTLELLDRAAGGPVFLWLHLVEPHYSYEQSPHVPSFGSDDVALYDAEIAEADRQLGRLVSGLRERQRLERTLLVVTGDHGEEFGEHGQRFHATNLYEPQVRTVAVLRVPGLPARRVREPIVLTDLTPTIERLLRVPELGARPSEGRNLLGLLLGGERPKPRFFLENLRVENGAQRATALVEWPFKLIYEDEGRTLELYDVERDPLERNNLYAASPATSSKLLGHLHARLESAAFPDAAPALRPSDRQETP